MTTKKKKPVITQTKLEKEIKQWQRLAVLLFDGQIHEHTKHKTYGKNNTYCKMCIHTRELYWKLQMKHFANEEEYCAKYKEWILR